MAIFSLFQYVACNTFDTVHINGLQWMCHIIRIRTARVPQCPSGAIWKDPPHSACHLQRVLHQLRTQSTIPFFTNECHP
jgi:hypothetical protein